ncbi:MAG TPA: heme exporter protein CcmD [Gammaproteobacteria bacterium]|nr:heme exporter protein CcmD [Gammaproteobacteria bacterium]
MMAANFSGFWNFLHMGGYGVYVWPAYGIVALVLLLQVWQARKVFFRFLIKCRRVNSASQEKESRNSHETTS